MLQLKLLPENVKIEYRDKIRTELADRIINEKDVKGNHYNLSSQLKSILIPNWATSTPDYSILNKLLTAEPLELEKLNRELWKNFGIPAASKAQVRKNIKHIFDYDGVFNTSSKSKSFWLAKLIDRNTCPYCNRQYCFTVVRGGGTNRKNRLVRPTFDHWFLKSKYPLLSLSLYNLIPSCYSCNSSIRNTQKLFLKKHIHPYVKEPASELDFSFRASKKSTERFAWDLKIDRRPGSKIDRTIKVFALDEIYSYHEKLEVKDIMMFDARYKKGYLASLFKNILKDSGFKLSREEVYRMLFGTEYSEEKYLDRPFSKLKHDLLKQIGVIK